MTRHSKNANARAFVSSSERSKLSWGSVSERLGADSLLPFGYCCLTLKPAKFPMASNQGWIFDRDAVVEYLAKEREALKAKLQAWETSNNPEKLSELEKSEASRALEQSWKASESNIVSSKKRPYNEVDDTTGSSFWVAVRGDPNSPSKQVKPDKPDTTPRCPMSGEKLRFKDLIPVNFELTVEGDADKGMFCCAITKRPITHQQALLIKPSGVVVLESAFKQSLDREDARCPITGAQLTKGDVIRLQTGGTSYSAHNKVEVKVHKYV